MTLIAGNSFKLTFYKSSKDLQRIEPEGKSAVMVLSSLFETEEAEAFFWDVWNLEVHRSANKTQIVVVHSTINYLPRVFGPVL